MATGLPPSTTGVPLGSTKADSIIEAIEGIDPNDEAIVSEPITKPSILPNVKALEALADGLVKPAPVGGSSSGSPTRPTSSSSSLGTRRNNGGSDSERVAVKKRIVIVGLGMVAVAFIEKLLKLDARREEYTIIVIGEEPHVAYNRVGLTSFFEHRDVEKLYLNPQSWYDDQHSLGKLSYLLSTQVTEINPVAKTVHTFSTPPSEVFNVPIENDISYDILVIATGSDAVIPTGTPGHAAQGVFVYRNLSDLQGMITYSALPHVKGSIGAVVGGGLLGLEAAKAMLDLENFGKVALVDKNPWVLSRQLDEDAGGLVGEKIRELGVDLKSVKSIVKIETDDQNRANGVVFADGEKMAIGAICYAIGIKPRDELARKTGMSTISRGGILVNDQLQTSEKDIYAIGECASWNNQTYGLIAPGVEMADILAFNLTQAKAHVPRSFKRPDLSTKLKLLGVDVASFGDYFADRDGPVAPLATRGAGARTTLKDVDSKKNPLVKALTYKDPFAAVYKKYLFSPDGKFLLGGMMIGDTKDYVKLVAMVKAKKPLEAPPGEFILGSNKGGDGDDADELDDDTQICSCHNVTKGDVVQVVKDGTCKSIGEVKSCTKAGTGCAGCMPLVESIFNCEMKKMGVEVSNHLCPHFAYSRIDLFNIISVKKLTNLPDVMKQFGKDPNSLGCEVCKPCLASIFASLNNDHVMSTPQHNLQDTNDKYLGNIQRNGTFSVVPRVAGGEITPERLIVIGQVAKKYGLYCKITGGQRIDMFGARKQDLVDIWTELVEAGMESGHAYAKSLRTVKSCVGSTWCRFGIGDSVGMAIRLEDRYKSIRAPHKFKGGVSGCVRECAEAQTKDFGLIATEKGYNIFVAGNGGAKPRHAELLIKDAPPDEVIPILDRYVMFYIRTAERLQRTARWLENLPGGIKYLREVILEDKLGICRDLEKQMSVLVGTYFCEWAEVVNDPVKRDKFKQFANLGTEKPKAAPGAPLEIGGIEIVNERGQTRPAYWPKEQTNFDFKGVVWKTPLNWEAIVEANKLDDSSVAAGNTASVTIKRGDTQLAIFKVRGKLYSTQQMCPHKRAFVLSDGLIGDDPATPGRIFVACPQHKKRFELDGPEESRGACLTDEKLSVKMFEVEERADGWIYLRLPSIEELDEVLGMNRWKVTKGETEADGMSEFGKLDENLAKEKAERRKALVGRKGVKCSGAGEGPILTATPAKRLSASEVLTSSGGCGGGKAVEW